MLMSEKIIFFHMNQLGDLMFSLPVLSAARKEWPNKELYSLVRSQHAYLLKATGYVNDVIVRPNNDTFSVLEILKLLRRYDFDKAVLFSESPETYLICFVSGIIQRYGFSTAAFSFLLTDVVKREGVPSLYNNSKLGAELGLTEIPADYTGLVTVPAEEMSAIKRWLNTENIYKNSLVVVAPGASLRRQEKHWQREKWVAVLKYLDKQGLTPVLSGAYSELLDLKTLSQASGFDCKIFTPQNDVLPLAALLKNSKFFVGIDSGAMHLAAALGVKVIALFGETDPNQVGPQPLSKHTIIKRDFMEYIRSEEVINGIKAFL